MTPRMKKKPRFPSLFFFSEHYLTAVSFSPDSSSAAANWVNRAQDEGAVMLCRAPQWACKEVRANSLTFGSKK